MHNTGTVTVDISKVTLRYGRVADSSYDPNPDAAALFIDPGVMVTIADSTITENSLAGSSNGYGAYAGAIENNGALTLTNVVMSQNSAGFGWGGAIYNTGD